jgi:multidrug efflux pump subunit AcrB
MVDKEDNTQNGESARRHKRGVAGAMAGAFIHSPLSPLLLLVALAIGVLGQLFTPRQEDPQISVPMVDIFVQYPGASASQVAGLVADPLERLMSEIAGVDHVYSVSQRDHAMVTVQFEVGEDMTDSLVKLYDKLQSNMDRIPPGVSQPLVKPKGVDDVPVVTLTLFSQRVDDSILRLIGLEVLQRLKEVPNTSQSFLVAGREEQLRVEVMPERLMGYDISLDQVANTIRAANSERGVGDVEAGGQSFAVYTGAFLRYAEDVEGLMIGVFQGRPVYVRDVARVILGPGEAHRLVRYYTGAASSEAPVDGSDAITIAIAKKTGTNGVTVANEVLARVAELEGEVIPDDVQVRITRNYGQTANDKVNELIFKLFIATGAVTLLIWFFLGLRAAIVVLVVIPVVILVTVFSAWVLGFTIDRVSLFALIFSIGILVDDAIVVVENIYRRWLMKRDTDTETAIDAVGEVGNPTILATFTVIAALLPMGFVSGMMGPYMAPIPALGSVAMIFSLFAAFIFTPWLTMRLKPSLGSLAAAADREHRQSERLEGFFRRLIFGMVQNKLLGRGFLIGIVVLFFALCAMFYTTDVRVKMLPLDNKPEFNVVINFPEGTPLPVTANLTHALAEELRALPEVLSLQTYVGTASPFNFNGLVRHYYLRSEPWQADIQVQLLHKNDRERSSHEIAVQTRALLSPIAKAAGARIQVVEMPPGPPVLQSVVAEIYGPGEQTRRQFARDMMAMFEEAESLDDVDSYLQAPHEVLRFEVDRDKALRFGVTVDDVNNALDMAMGGHVVGDLKLQSSLDPTLIVLQLPMDVRADISRINLLPVATRAGGVVPLGELGRFVRAPQDAPIYHKDLRPVEYVTAETVGRLAAPIYGMLEVEDLLDAYSAPDGVRPQGYYLGPPPDNSVSGFEWGGEWTVTYETFRDMGLAFAVALVLIYMLVVWEFGNFVLPAIVMAPIPLTLIGIIPGHWLLDAEFTATSMIGFIALAGIIVRNSILLVDFSREAVDQGVAVDEAMVKACQARTRPILITALALIAGSGVILFDPIFQGMAISLMFGTLVSTLLTLVVIPLGCISGRSAFCPMTAGPDGMLHSACDDDPPAGGGGSAPAGAPQSGGIARGLMVPFQYGGMYFYALGSSFLIGMRDLGVAAAGLVGRLLGASASPTKAAPEARPAATKPAAADTSPAAAPASKASAPKPSAEKKVMPSGGAAVAKQAGAEKSAPETATPKQAAPKQATPKQAAPKQAAPKKAAPKQAAPKQATPKQAAPKQAAPKQAVPKKAAAKKAVPKKAAPKKAAAKQAAPKKAVPKKVAPKQAVPKKVAPKQAVPKKAVPKQAGPAQSPATGTAKRARRPRRGIRLKDDSNDQG